jgi:uncharacterized protein (DUF2249 family)
MNAVELANVLDEKYTLPLAHEAAEMIRTQHAGILMALASLKQGNKLDVVRAIEILEEAS